MLTDMLKSINSGRMNEQEVINMAEIKSVQTFGQNTRRDKVFGVLTRSQKILLKWLLLICEERGLYLTGS